MPIEPPPSRYRVVERGRGLEVIDTWAKGRPVPPNSRPPAARRDVARPLGAITKTSFDGRAKLTTSALYDLNGPRTIALDPLSAKLFGGTRLAVVVLMIAWLIAAIIKPALFVLVVPFLSGKTWKPIRKKTTAWLDRAVAGEA